MWRVLTWYVRTAYAALIVLNPRHPKLPFDPPDSDCQPLAFSNFNQALAWYKTEQKNVLALVRSADIGIMGLLRIADVHVGLSDYVVGQSNDPNDPSKEYLNEFVEYFTEHNNQMFEYLNEIGKGLNKDGDTLYRAGQVRKAHLLWREAHNLLDGLGSLDASRVRARLDVFDSDNPDQHP